jgi:hypothetical protein
VGQNKLNSGSADVAAAAGSDVSSVTVAVSARRTVSPEFAVRVGGEPVQGHIAMHTQLDQGRDLVRVQGGGVGADPDVHPGRTERPHDVQEVAHRPARLTATERVVAIRNPSSR